MIMIDDLNHMDLEEFMNQLGGVFEDTPAIARRVWDNRPFANLEALHQSLVDDVKAMNVAEQLALIRAHPDLGSKAKMAEASVKEQAVAGLDQLTADEYQQFQQLNQAYQEQFEFPFIIAVKNHTKESILEAFRLRLHHSVEVEREGAIAEIIEIARLRLAQVVQELE
jgi:2-oxo-4-hydroxy-4-carboxy-5-ureidoimidazoline decarboxylase